MMAKLYNGIMTGDSKFRIFFGIALIAITMIARIPAYAQQEQQIITPQESLPAPAAEPLSQNRSMPPQEDEVTILQDKFTGKYNQSTIQNLSKLYWRLGAFDFDDDAAVGNFIKINDCKIYTEYLNDDLEWKQILTVMKGHLKKNRETFPIEFQFMMKLHLGRYDPDLGGFALIDRTGFTDAKRIEVNSMDRDQEVCHDRSLIPDYPVSTVILPSEPFTLDFLKLDEHVAQAYILRKKSEYLALPENEQVRRYEREAYLRLRVSFSQYHGNVAGDKGEPMAIMFGNIDGYEIFEDSAQKRLMLSIDLKDNKGAMSQPAIKDNSVIVQTPDQSGVIPTSMGFTASP